MRTHDFFDVLSGYDSAVSLFVTRCQVLRDALEDYKEGDDTLRIREAFVGFRDGMGFILNRILGNEGVIAEIMDMSEDGAEWFDQRNRFARSGYELVEDAFRRMRFAKTLPEEFGDYDLRVRINGQMFAFPFFDALIERYRAGVRFRPAYTVYLNEEEMY